MGLLSTEKKIDSACVSYISYLMRIFPKEIDINMSFLNCNYTKTVQILAKLFIQNIQISNKIDNLLAQAFIELSTYYIKSFDIIFKEKYDKMNNFHLHLSLEDVKKRNEEIKKRDYEELVMQHKHLMYILGG